MLSQSGEATTNDKLQALKMIEVLKDRNGGEGVVVQLVHDEKEENKCWVWRF